MSQSRRGQKTYAPEGASTLSDASDPLDASAPFDTSDPPGVPPSLDAGALEVDGAPGALTPAERAGTIGSPFARRVAGVFGARVGVFIMSFFASILLKALLGPDDNGAFIVVSTLPGMLTTLGLFGLPNAINYFAGRGASVASLTRAMLLFTTVLAVVVVAIVWVSLPFLEQSVLSAAPDQWLRLILLTVPLSMLATFGGTLLYGRQTVRTYNLILVGQAAGALATAAILVGVFKLGLEGAVAGNVAVSVIVAIAVMAAVRRLGQRDHAGPPAPMGGLLGYGAKVFPAAITGFFNYRADTYIIQALILDSRRAVGLYGLAVTMAELVFYIPDSIGTMFLPRVAGSTPEEANRMLGRVGRFTALLTLVAALALIPAAIVGVYVVLPAYRGSLPAFFALLPGVVSLSLGKVMTSFVNGRGRPGPVSIAAALALVINIGFNIVLIPAFGIVGASLSSVVSYTAMTVMMVIVASRLSGLPIRTLVLPGRAEVNLLVSGLRRAATRARSRRWRVR